MSSVADPSGLRRSHACAVCARGKRRCDGNRPCGRCERLGIQHKCVDPDATMMPTRKRKQTPAASSAPPPAASSAAAATGTQRKAKQPVREMTGSKRGGATANRGKKRQRMGANNDPTSGQVDVKFPDMAPSTEDLMKGAYSGYQGWSQPALSQQQQYGHSNYAMYDKPGMPHPPATNTQYYNNYGHFVAPVSDPLVAEGEYVEHGARMGPGYSSGIFPDHFSATGTNFTLGDRYSSQQWQGGAPSNGVRLSSGSDTLDTGDRLAALGKQLEMDTTTTLGGRSNQRSSVKYTMAPMSNSTTRDIMGSSAPLRGGTTMGAYDSSFFGNRSSPLSFDDMRRRSSSANSEDLLTSTFRAMAQRGDEETPYPTNPCRHSPFSAQLYQEIEQYNSPVLYVLYNGSGASTPKRIYLNSLAQDLFGRSAQEVSNALSKDENVIWIHPKYAPLRHDASNSARAMGVKNYEFKGKYLRKLPAERGQTHHRFSVFEAREHISVEYEPRKKRIHEDSDEENGLGLLMKFSEIRECTDEVISINEEGVAQYETLKESDESRQRRHSFLMTMVNKDPSSSFSEESALPDTRKRTDSSESGLSNMSLNSMCDALFIQLHNHGDTGDDPPAGAFETMQRG